MNDDMLELSMWRDGNIMHGNCLEDMAKLKAERDEARREVLEGMHPDLRQGYAAAREWDCFKSVTESYEKIANKYHTTFQKLAQEESSNEEC